MRPTSTAARGEAQIAAAQQEHGRLGLGWVGLDPGSPELDCGTLIYCSAGGTGRFQESNGPGYDRAHSPPFPECCDPDKDGLGSLLQSAPPPGATNPFGPDGGAMSIYHGATVDQIQAGDVLIERGTIHGVPQESAATVGFVFSTFPALASYSDGQGDSASLSYPRSDAFSLPVRADSNGNVVLTLTFWRPQRQRIEGEESTGEWVDVGNLAYATGATLARPDEAGAGTCPESSYSAMDPNLLPLSSTSAPSNGPPTYGAIRFADQRGDQPSSPTNTFSYTLNVTDCLAARGISPDTSTPFDLSFWAFALADNGAGTEVVESMTNSQAQFQLQ